MKYLNHDAAHRILPQVINEPDGFRSWFLSHQLVELILELNGYVRIPIKLGTATVDFEIVV